MFAKMKTFIKRDENKKYGNVRTLYRAMDAKSLPNRTQWYEVQK